MMRLFLTIMLFFGFSACLHSEVQLTADQRAQLEQLSKQFCVEAGDLVGQRYSRLGIRVPDWYVKGVSCPGNENFPFLYARITAVVAIESGGRVPPSIVDTGVPVADFLESLVMPVLLDGTHAVIGNVSRHENRVTVTLQAAGSPLIFDFTYVSGESNRPDRANLDSIRFSGERIDNLMAFNVILWPRLIDPSASQSLKQKAAQEMARLNQEVKALAEVYRQRADQVKSQSRP